MHREKRSSRDKKESSSSSSSNSLPFRLAVVCASNQNRSMEAHNVLKKAGYNVSSYGTGSAVRLPGPSADRPNIYPFGTPYDDIYKDLMNKDPQLYRDNKLLPMLERNRMIKKSPERFQEHKEILDVIITCEERCFDAVLDELNARPAPYNRIVHVINVDIRDTPEDALVGGQVILQLVEAMKTLPDLDSDVDEHIESFSQTNPNVSFLHSVTFY